MTKVWFIRHAESEANAGRPTFDPAQVELTERGWGQAEDIAQLFPTKPSLIVTSSFLRTKQTAEPTRRRFPDVKYDEWRVHEFTYLSLPPQLSTRQQRRPLVEKFWKINDPYYVDGDGVESFFTFTKRVKDVFDLLKISNEEFIAIFSHGQFIHAVFWALKYGSLPTDMKVFQHFLTTVPLYNGEILEIPSWQEDATYLFNHLPPPSKPIYKLLDPTRSLVPA